MDGEVKVSLANVKIETGDMCLDEDNSIEEKHFYLSLKEWVNGLLKRYKLLKPGHLGELSSEKMPVLRDNCILLVGLMNHILIHVPGMATTTPVPEILQEGLPRGVEFRLHVHKLFMRKGLGFNELHGIANLTKDELVGVVIFLTTFIKDMFGPDGIPGLGDTPVAGLEAFQ